MQTKVTFDLWESTSWNDNRIQTHSILIMKNLIADPSRTKSIRQNHCSKIVNKSNIFLRELEAISSLLKKKKKGKEKYNC